MNDKQKEEIKKFVSERYGHLSSSVQERILQAYIASTERTTSSLLKDRSANVITNLTSTNYKDFLFNDNSR